MRARRHRSILGLPWILLAAAIGLPQDYSVLRASTVQHDRPATIALVGFGLSTTEREHPWAIIRDETTREEEIFEPGDTVFKTGKLLRIGRTGVEIMRPQATVLRLSLAGQELAPESNDFDELEGNDIFGEAADIEQRPSFPATQLSSTLGKRGKTYP